MSSYNSVHLIGHLGKDAERKDFSTGNSLIVFSLATTEYWKDREGKKQEHTEWHRCEMNGEQGKRIFDYLKKGKCLLLEGAIRSAEWTSKGEKKRATKIRVRKIVLLTPSGKTGPRAEDPVEATTEPEPGPFQVSDDDVPF